MLAQSPGSPRVPAVNHDHVELMMLGHPLNLIQGRGFYADLDKM
jgi:hypothetical protein